MVKKIADNIDDVLASIEATQRSQEIAALKKQLKAALLSAAEAHLRADAVVQLSTPRIRPPKKIARRRANKKNNATIVVMLSDWHVEERVLPQTVGGANDYSLAIADARIRELSDGIAAAIEREREEYHVDHVVVAAMGDFISGHIHEDNIETAQLPPLAACRWAGERIAMIVARCAASAERVDVITCVGNHGRTTPKNRIATEYDHSFEHNLYEVLAAGERAKNVKWHVGGGYLHSLDLGGFTITAHHGHAIGGGGAGLHASATRASNSWRSTYPTDLFLFGHHHQWGWSRRDGWVCNGALIGYNSYALRIRALAEPPCQSLIVIDRSRRETVRAYPIFCDGDRRT